MLDLARLPRLDVQGVAQHMIQRGNNHRVCFGSDQDIAAYAGWLHEYSVKHSVSVHAWVFMTYHVHLLVTPREVMKSSLVFCFLTPLHFIVCCKLRSFSTSKISLFL